MMSLLILAVGWAYTQICRIYPDGGGVYTAAKHRNRTLAVIGALLLFADYTVTASLSSLDAFHYFGLPLSRHAQIEEAKRATIRPETSTVVDAGNDLNTHRDEQSSPSETLFRIDSPGLWSMLAIAAIGLFNLMGPKHTGGVRDFRGGWHGLYHAADRLFRAAGYSLVGVPQAHPLASPDAGKPAGAALDRVRLDRVGALGRGSDRQSHGRDEKARGAHARKAIWVVASEVAIFNVLLAAAMLAIHPLDREAHVNDMLAFLSSYYTSAYVGASAEWAVRIIGGLLLLSATNTALTDMISVQYLMARDGELPAFMQKLNRFGVPWLPAVVAAGVPIAVLLVSHNLEALAALYAIGVIGAVAINVTLCALHPRLRRLHRKVPMLALGVLLLLIWVTLAYTKHHALIFVMIVLSVGLAARTVTKWLARRRGERPSLLRQAIMEQLPADAMSRPKLLIGTYGSDALGPAAMEQAKRLGAALVVAFIRQVSLSYKYEGEKRLTIETDQAALKTFARFLELGHEASVPVIPVYDTGPDAAELLAETAAMTACQRVLIGTSRQGAIFHFIKGHFQRRLEALLPPDIPVQVISADAGASAAPPPPAAPGAAATDASAGQSKRDVASDAVR